MREEIRNIYALSRINFFDRWPFKITCFLIYFILALVIAFSSNFDDAYTSVGNIHLLMSLPLQLVYLGVFLPACISDKNTAKNLQGTDRNKLLGEFFGIFAWALIFTFVNLALAFAVDIYISSINGATPLNSFNISIYAGFGISLMVYSLCIYGTVMLLLTLYRLHFAIPLVLIFLMCIFGRKTVSFINVFFNKFLYREFDYGLSYSGKFLFLCFLVFLVCFILSVIISSFTVTNEDDINKKSANVFAVIFVAGVIYLFAIGFIEDTNDLDNDEYVSVYYEVDGISYGEGLREFDNVKEVSVDISNLPEGALKCDSIRLIWERDDKESIEYGIMLDSSLAKEEGIEFDESLLDEDTALIIYGWDNLSYRGQTLDNGIDDSLISENFSVSFNDYGSDRSELIEEEYLKYEDGYTPGSIEIRVQNDTAPDYYINGIFGISGLTDKDTGVGDLADRLYEEVFFIYKD